jgi:hypothetical protein
MIDNSYPYFPFIRLYKSNCPTKAEFEDHSKFYLGLCYENSDQSTTKEKYIEDKLPQFIENLFCSMILDGFYWGVWGILMINEIKINDEIFNFGFVQSRIELSNHLLSLDFFKEVIDNKLNRVKLARIG